jgi:hypothetical protein
VGNVELPQAAAIRRCCAAQGLANVEFSKLAGEDTVNVRRYSLWQPLKRSEVDSDEVGWQRVEMNLGSLGMEGVRSYARSSGLNFNEHQPHN